MFESPRQQASRPGVQDAAVVKDAGLGAIAAMVWNDIWTYLFNGGDYGELPSKGIRVPVRLHIGSGGCASGRLAFQYELISLTVVTTGNCPAKGYEFHLDFILALELSLIHI